MTDDKNKFPDDETEEEFADFEDDFAEEGLEEDFHEDGEEFVEEDWEAYDEEGDFPMADEGGKKSSKLVVIVGGLLLLGGAGYAAMQVIGNGAAPQTQSALPAADDVADAMPVPDAMSPAGDNAAMGANGANTASQNGMAAPSATQDFTPPPSDPELDFEMPMPFSNNNEPADTAAGRTNEGDTAPDSTDNIDAQPLTPLPQDSGATGEESGLMASGDPADNMQDDAAAAEDNSGGNIPAWDGPDSAETPSGDAASPQSAAIDGSALASLENKLDKLFNRLDAIESELDQVKKSGSNNDVSGRDINELQSKIRQLERELGNMSARSSSAASADTSPKSTSTASEQSSGTGHNAPEASARDWILTSAQPGKATLRKAGGNDVISVEVGDSVSGLGRVISIGLEDGKWVVKATSGHVSQ